MDDEDLVIEDEAVEATDSEVEQETEEVEEEPVEDADDSEEPDSEEEEDDRIVTFGDEQPDEPEAPGWVKKVRQVNRKLESENKKLKKMLQERSTEQTQEAPVQVGEKPTLKSVGYDDKKYEEALASYYERKRKADEYQAQKAQREEQQRKQWEEKQRRYVQQKEAHGFKDYEEAEEIVSNTFDLTQQGIIVQGAEDSALVVYALGKNPKKLEELAKITDPVDFAFKVAKLEAQLKVTSKKAPKPEKRISGAKAGGLSGTEDKTLERLREEAAKTGDYSKILVYKKKKRGK